MVDHRCGFLLDTLLADIRRRCIYVLDHALVMQPTCRLQALEAFCSERIGSMLLSAKATLPAEKGTRFLQSGMPMISLN